MRRRESPPGGVGIGLSRTLRIAGWLAEYTNPEERATPFLEVRCLTRSVVRVVAGSFV
jgi:hypothetical protein